MAKFLGEMNFLEGKLESVSGDTARVITSAGPLAVTSASQFREPRARKLKSAAKCEHVSNAESVGGIDLLRLTIR